MAFVCRNSNIQEQTFRSLMLETGEISNDVGTVLFGADAVKYGLIDHVGGISDAMDELKKRMKQSET